MNWLVTYTITVSNEDTCNVVDTYSDVAIGFDTSGSMRNTIGFARDAVNSLLDALNPDTDQAALVTYNTNASLAAQLTSNFDSVRVVVNGLSAGGWTNIRDGIGFASSELQSGRANLDASKFIVLFTDGRTNRPLPAQIADDYALSQAANAKAAGVTIYVVGFGNRIDVDFLTSVASPGNYFAATSGQALIDAFEQIGGEISERYPTTIEDNLTALFEIAEVVSISDDGVLEDGKITWDLGFMDCQERTVSYTVRVNENAEDGDILINDAEIIYRGGEVTTQSVSVAVEETVSAEESSTPTESPTPTGTPDSFPQPQITILPLTGEAVNRLLSVLLLSLLVGSIVTLYIVDRSDNKK